MKISRVINIFKKVSANFMNLMASSRMEDEGVVRETGIEVTLQKIQMH